MKFYYTWLWLPVLLIFLLRSSAANAQITLDGTMGVAGALTGPNFTIPAAVGQTRGSNLFHSFGLFNVQTNQSATFTGPNTISNIFGRVTGGQQSNINGTILSTIANANLYLMNPAGVLFGPNARLSVGGSFHVTTADYFKFADNAKYHADLSRQSTLTSAAVSAFGFLSQNPAAISIQESVLQVPSGKALSIVGGDIAISGGPLGFLRAPAGQINLGSIAAPGDLPVDLRSFEPLSHPALGQIRLDHSALLTTSGASGGAVVIRGGKLLIDGSSTILANALGPSSGAGIDIAVANDLSVNGGAVLQSVTTNFGDAGGIKLAAGQDLFIDSARLESFASDSSFGRAGDISIFAGRDLRLNDVTIDSSSLGFGASGVIRAQAQRDALFRLTNIDTSSNNGFAGQAGDVTLSAGSNLSFEFGSIVTFTDSFFGERAGDVTIAAGHQATIEVSDINTNSFSFLSRAGDVQIAADRLTLDFAGIDTSSFGERAGKVQFNVGDLDMKNGSTIRTVTLGDGAGGNIVIDAQQSAAITGSSSFPSALDASASQAQGFPTPGGEAGSISITAPELVLDNAILVSVTAGTGRGGNIDLRGQQISARNQTLLVGGSSHNGAGGSITIEGGASIAFEGQSGIINGSEGAGNTGPVTLRAPIVTLSGENLIGANTSGSGNGGAITIDAAQVTLSDGFGLTSITTAGATGKGGDITVTASESILFLSTAANSRQSGVFTSTGGDGHAGNIVISSPKVTLDNGVVGAFSADALQSDNRGNAGNITFSVGQLSLQNEGRISAGTSGASAHGAGGQILIEAAKGVVIDGSSAILNGVEGTGNAGPIIIRAPVLAVSGPQGLIENSSGGAGSGGLIDINVASLRLDGGVISSASNASGSGGTIKVVAGDINLSGPGGLFTDSLASGAAGHIDVRANQITFSAGAQISAESQGTGNTGNIDIVADSLRSFASSITAKSELSDGGNIHLKIASLLQLQNSQITATVKGGAGTGGNILIDPQFVVLNNSQITANAFGGPGGKVTIIADNFLATPDSAVTASSTLSTPGTVDIQAPITDLSGSLAPLPEGIVQATSLLRQSCATRYGSGKLSSLSSSGRGGMPFEPGGLLASAILQPAERSMSQGIGDLAQPLFASAKPIYSVVSPCGKL